MKKFSIITGFLGSGKTTLLNRLLRHPDMKTTAVLINELGDVGVDNLIVDELDEDVVLLESGCVCCTVRDDLTGSLLRLYEGQQSGTVPHFEHVMLETTGIADPAPILQLIMSDPLVCERYRIGTVITVVDACFGTSSLDAIPEAVRQVAMADRLVISKTDLAAPASVERLTGRLRDMNPSAARMLSEDAQPQTLFVDELAGTRPISVTGSFHSNRFGTFQLQWPDPVRWCSVETWLEGLLSARGEDLWRIKGLLNIEGSRRPVLLQTVQHSAYAPVKLRCWPGQQPGSNLTFIARHFSRKAAIESLRPFMQVSVSD